MEEYVKGKCIYKHLENAKDAVCTITLDGYVVRTDEDGVINDGWDELFEDMAGIPDSAFYDSEYGAALTDAAETSEQLAEYLIDKVNGTLTPNSAFEVYIITDVCYGIEECYGLMDRDTMDSNVYEQPAVDYYFDVNFTPIEE